MILGTERTKPRQIGGRYVGIKGLDYDQPFVVLREATYEEWAAERLKELGHVPDPPCDLSEALFLRSLDGLRRRVPAPLGRTELLAMNSARPKVM
jgi:hypothetical protein